MSNEQGAAGSFTVQDRNSLKQWLDSQPDEYSTVISSRAALRALPFLIRTRQRAKNFEQFSCWVFSSFWASALAWAEAKYPRSGMKEFSRDAYLAAAAVDEDDFEPQVEAADAAALAALTVSRGYNFTEAAARAVETAVEAYGGMPSAAIRQGVSSDVAALQKGSTPDRLAGAPLWLSQPEEIQQHWLKLRSELSQSEWRLWLDWYQRRLDGRELSQDIEILFAELPVDPRSINVADQNELLAEKIAELSTPVMSSDSAGSNSLPNIPDPAPGPCMAVRDERLDISMHRSPDHAALGRRSTALLAELREAVRDFANSFDAKSNQHRQLRNVLNRYRDLIEIDDPDVDTVFALGLRLENAASAGARSIQNGFEPSLEDSQHESLASVLRIHAVFIATDPDGIALLAAAERYAFKPQEDAQFKTTAHPVVESIGHTPQFVKERLAELLREALAELGEGEYPARTALLGRNSIQGALVWVTKYAVGGVLSAVAGQIVIHSHAGHFVINEGVAFADKAIAFLLNNDVDLRALAATAPEGFGFLDHTIDWLRSKLDV